MKSVYLLVLLYFICLPFISAIKNQNVNQLISVSSQIAHYDIAIDIFNDEKTTITSYDFIVPSLKHGELSILNVKDSSDRIISTSDDQKDSSNSGKSERLIKIPVTIPPSSSSKIYIEAVFTHVTDNYPKKIKQSDRQLSRFFGNKYFYSPYNTDSVTTVVALPAMIINHSKEEPIKKDGYSLTYGPFSNIKPKSESEFFVHFENNVPILTINRLVREVEVSHWGNVAVEDFMFITNQGAELESGFSRLDYQTNPNIGHVIRSMQITLPNEATNVYYRDHIGNISTSHWWKNSLQIEPRFPLFGGWKTKFCLGYDLPLHQHVGVNVENTNTYTLTIPVGPDFVHDVVVDEQEIKIILPEGVSDINIESPFSFDSQEFDTKRTYLDIEGRQVVILVKKNLINYHETSNIKVTYKFSSSLMWREPLMLVGGFFALFMLIIIGSRLNFSLTPKTKTD